jgi:hypothetical protein
MVESAAAAGTHLMGNWRDQLVESSGRPEYRWLRPIVETTLEKRVVAAFFTFAPRPMRFKPSRVEEHLGEASALLDQCRRLRDQIFDLEAQALLTALEYQNTEANFDSDGELALLQFTALKKQAVRTESDDPSSQILINRAERSKALLLARLDLHNVPNSSLNFGERVEFLSGIFIDTLRSAFERIGAAQVGLQDSFGLSLGPVPSYDQWTGDLNFLVWSVRRAIRGFEEGLQTERISTIYLFLARDGMIFQRTTPAEPPLPYNPPETIRKLLLQTGSAQLEFMIGEDYLANHGLDTKRSYRVIGASAAVVYDGLALSWIKEPRSTEQAAIDQMRSGLFQELVDSVSFPGTIGRIIPPMFLPLPPGVMGPDIYDIPDIDFRIRGKFQDLLVADVDNEPLLGLWELTIDFRPNFPFNSRGGGDIYDRAKILETSPNLDVVVSLRIAHRQVIND